MKLYISDYSVPTSHCLREYIKNRPLNNARIGPKEKSYKQQQKGFEKLKAHFDMMSYI